MKKAKFYIGLFNLLLSTATAFASDSNLEVDSQDTLLKQLQAKNEELQIQQETLLKKVVTLKQQIQKSTGGSVLKNDLTDNSFKQELIGLKQELEESNAQIEREKTNVRKLADYILSLRKEIRVKEEALDKSNLENSSLKSTVGDLQTSFETCDLKNDEKAKILSEFPQLKKKLIELELSTGVKDVDLKACNEKKSQLETISATIPDLKKELMATKNELMMKEVELEQLGKKPVKQDNQQAKNVVQHQRELVFEEQGRKAGDASLGKKDRMISDVTIVEVLGDKVALRSGPSPEDSEIMSVGKASRLTVEERIGDWFRVVAPNSMRAFIRADMVKVISKNNLDLSNDYPTGRASLETLQEQAPTIVRPKKKALRTINTNNMVPFEEEAAPKEKVDRAFEQLKSGLNIPKSDK